MVEDYDEKKYSQMYRRLIQSGFTDEGAMSLRLIRGGIYGPGIQKVRRNRQYAVKKRFMSLVGKDGKALWNEAKKEIKGVDDFHLREWMQTREAARTKGGGLWFQAVTDVEEERWRRGFIESSSTDYFLQYYLGLRRKMSRKEMKAYADDNPDTWRGKRTAQKLKSDRAFYSKKQREKEEEKRVLRGDED